MASCRVARRGVFSELPMPKRQKPVKQAKTGHHHGNSTVI